jgi:MtN3 and saliva related transmembrane protein
MDAWAETLGLVAGGITTASFLPQVVQTWRSKSAKDLSLPMYATLSAGILLWIAYGLCIGSFSVILANSLSLILNILILLMKIRFGDGPKSPNGPRERP